VPAPPIYEPSVSWVEAADLLRRKTAWGNRDAAACFPGLLVYKCGVNYMTSHLNRCVEALMDTRKDAPTEAEFVEALAEMVQDHPEVVRRDLASSARLHKLLFAEGQ
jgi:hypothetical protein